MKTMILTTILILLCHLISLAMSQTLLLSSCDYQKYPSNGCEDELGSDCDTTAMKCRCKSHNDVVVNNRFCFPVHCPKGQYYDHNLERCEPQRKATLNSHENYCRFDFHCKGNHIYCRHFNQWNYQCVCDRGFVYDTSTQECQLLKGLNGFCSEDKDCDLNQMRNLVCVEKSCQCAHGFTYNNVIDGCEDNERIKERDSQTRKMMYLFIGLGLFFGAALSLKFGTSSVASTQQLLLKRIVENRQQQREEQRQQRLAEQELHLQQEQTAIELDSDDKSEHLINRSETA